jgi:hypothetical protein
MNARQRKDLVRRVAWEKTAGRNGTNVLATGNGDNMKTGTVMPPLKVIATDRKLVERTPGQRKISAAAEFPQSRWEWSTI